MISFENTKIAFSAKSNRDLKRAYWLFKLVASQGMVKFGQVMTNFALAIHFPMSWIIKPTIFRQFCGGETIDECETTTTELAAYGIGTILDYSVEGKESSESFEATTREIVATIHKAQGNDHIPFSVFKISGISTFALLEKKSSGADLSTEEQSEWEKVEARLDRICKAAYDGRTPILIDAEESWIQIAIDDLADQMMARYNQERMSVYNTVQMYRHDRLEFLKASHQKAQVGNYLLGIKLVRGAYMEKERSRAAEKGYQDPIQPNKKASDQDYNLALEYCIQHIDEIYLVAGTHNEESSMHLAAIMETAGLPNHDPRITFAQLYGMSDHISYNLSNDQYNVAKYVPYGPVREVIPYLIRRAQENTSAAGQTGRELSLIIKERKRRKNK